jgi:hypothetical protein
MEARFREAFPDIEIEVESKDWKEALRSWL